MPITVTVSLVKSNRSQKKYQFEQNEGQQNSNTHFYIHHKIFYKNHLYQKSLPI